MAERARSATNLKSLASWFVNNIMTWFLAGLVLFLAGKDLTETTAVWALGALWYEYQQYKAGHQPAPLNVYFESEAGSKQLIVACGEPFTVTLVLANQGTQVVTSAAVDVWFPGSWDVAPAYLMHYYTETEGGHVVCRYTAVPVLHPERKKWLGPVHVDMKDAGMHMGETRIRFAASCEGFEATTGELTVLTVPPGSDALRTA